MLPAHPALGALDAIIARSRVLSICHAHSYNRGPPLPNILPLHRTSLSDNRQRWSCRRPYAPRLRLDRPFYKFFPAAIVDYSFAMLRMQKSGRRASSERAQGNFAEVM